MTPSAQYYTPRYPVIPKPARPQLVNVTGDELGKMSPAASAAVTTNFDKLMDYARKLEIGIEEYNKFAVEKNLAFTPKAKLPEKKQKWDGKSPFTKP